MANKPSYVLIITPQLKAAFKSLKLKKPSLFVKLKKQISKILREPAFGKPLRNVLRNYRRIHIESHVLIYEIRGNEIWLLDFAHHDKVYK